MDWTHEHPEYENHSLTDTVPKSPWVLWEQWQHDAKPVMKYSNEIALAVSDAHAVPSVRMVLLKHSSEEKGFCWFSNRGSKKGRALHENPLCEILWYSKELQRQVRIQGKVKELPRDEVQSYAHSRPRDSQLSAYFSKQSSRVASRTVLHEEFHRAEKQFYKKDIPLSLQWTGYSLTPRYFEFWQGSTIRLHDRISYTQDSQHLQWNIERLYP